MLAYDHHLHHRTHYGPDSDIGPYFLELNMQNNHVIPLHDDFDEWWAKEGYDEQVKFMSLVMRKRIKSNMRKAYKAGKASLTRGDAE